VSTAYLVPALSVELPESSILAKQMSKELLGKTVETCSLQGCEKFQKIGFVNTYLSDFDKLADGKIQSIVSRGNVIRVKFDNGVNLLLAPEYGGKIFYHPTGSTVPKKFHLRVVFNDQSSFTVTLTGMGIIHVLSDGDLGGSYVYRRDFSEVPSPQNPKEFTLERFSKDLAKKNVNLKAALVGKDAVIVGLGNSMFQDVVFRAGLHPKRKASELSDVEKQTLYNAVRHVVAERIRLGGKEEFVDFYGQRGGYVAAMGPNMKAQHCLACGAEVSKLSIGGGQAYYCPKCQR
jgi:formamidopyrimidine-DNA glycosylase